MDNVLGDGLQARLVLVVLGAADERRLLIVEAAISRSGHVLLLVGRALVTAEAVEVSLYGFCQARGLATISTAERTSCAMGFDGFGAAPGLNWGEGRCARRMDGSEGQDARDRVGQGRMRDCESKERGDLLIAVGKSVRWAADGCG